MASSTAEQLANVASLDALYGELDGMGVGPGWNKPTPSLWPSPRKTLKPAHWSYAQTKPALDAAGRLISTELAERRNLILFNPCEGNTYGTVRTLVAAYQMIMPGEWARSHRHTPNALRLVLDAEPGTYTVVNGAKIGMEPGDVLLTPSWCFHGHGNDSGASAYWLDFLDAPLVQLLEPMFLEADQTVTDAASVQAAPIVRDSPFIFPITETRRRLDEAAQTPQGPCGTVIELGDPALSTIALYMMRLAPKLRTACLRTTAGSIYAVVEGSGATVIDGERFEWSRGDVVAAPAWRPHYHEAASDAILLRVTDEPALQRLGLLRAEGDAAAG